MKEPRPLWSGLFALAFASTVAAATALTVATGFAIEADARAFASFCIDGADVDMDVFAAADVADRTMVFAEVDQLAFVFTVEDGAGDSDDFGNLSAMIVANEVADGFGDSCLCHINTLYLCLTAVNTFSY